jgi:pilus assembly protein Flp/PilA
MKAIMNRAKAFLKSEDGPTATEYAVMLALIIVVCITAVQAIGTKSSAAFQAVASAM